MVEKNWMLKPEPPEDFQQKFSQYHPLIQGLLYNRNLHKPNEIECFLFPEFDKLHDPFLFNHMKKAVDRILQAINSGEKIIIHGDYDADGVTSSSILFKTLQALVAEVQLATENGLEVIVTDHHEAPAILPNAFAIINPKVKGEKYPFEHLCAAGVAYKLSVALIESIDKETNELNKWGGKKGFLKWLLDIVAIGTVSDMMPLIDENRILVRYGLIVLKQTRRPGLIKLLEIAGIDLAKLSATTIGYQIGPRLNAAGRLKHAEVAFKLLTTDDFDEANLLATELQATNVDRQKITEDAIKQAKTIIESQSTQKIYFIYNESWNPGVIGLIAGKISNEYCRPVMAMTKVGEQIVGSGRSIESFNITEVLYQAEKLLSRFGGHAQACGFTISKAEHLSEFQKIILDKADAMIKIEDLKPIISIDSTAKLADFNLDLMKKIEAFAPFGEGNPKPLFLIKQLEITAIDKIGNGEKHLRLMAKQGTSLHAEKFLAFGMADSWGEVLCPGDVIEVVVELGVNVWNGVESVEARIVDLKKN